MQLLVSVRAGVEVAAALAGGADILDAKEPAHGGLGPVGEAKLEEIAARVPDSVSFSVALGDFSAPAAVRDAVAGVRVAARPGPTFVKLGFAGERSTAVVTSLIAAALDAGAAAPLRPIVVPVAYADHGRAATPAPEYLLRAAMAAGARVFLLDTLVKDGRGLFDWMPHDRLRGLSGQARSAGLLFALAGSLTLDSVDRAASIADVVGVRGAACRGGREGSVDAALVRELHRRMVGAPSALAAVK